METNEIVRLILSDNQELSKSTRYHNLTLEKKVDVIISQRPELKNRCVVGVSECAVEKVITYIEQDAEIAMPIEELMPEGKHLSKKEYGLVLLKHLAIELRQHFL